MEDVKELIWFNPKEILPKENVYVLCAFADFSYRPEAPYYESPYWAGRYIEDDEWRDDAGEAFHTKNIKRWAYIQAPQEDKV